MTQMGYDRDAFRLNGQDDVVEVNQRALIDKVLARYSGEFTVFRELLQNSDDAQSPVVEIRFETAEYLQRTRGAKQGKSNVPPLPDLKSTHVVRWTFRNNGFPFRDEDWARLRRIAEGNPDEEKIGAFGVGFYSLFSMTENPFVSSGGYGMEFYWKDNKDQLQVRRGDLPSKGGEDPWTTFEMVLREAGPIPPAFDLMRFLASSITFMTFLNEVSVHFDEHRIGYIKKSPGVSKAVDFPIPFKQSSESRIMNVKEIQSYAIKIEAEVMHAVYAVGTAKGPSVEVQTPRKPKPGASVLSPPLKDPTELHKTNVTLTAFTAEVKVILDEKLFAEFHRSTKKNPPSAFKYHLIYTGKSDYDQSFADDRNQPAGRGSIFQGLRADLNGAIHTRIFIGHATGQSTGIGGHMASYFIPTVERESIDFVDKNIAIWNKELLYVGGLLCRAAYELELSKIGVAWEDASKANPNSRPPQELQSRLQDQFIHTLKFFAFHRSTPSEEVGKLLEAAFYGCSTSHLRVLSTIGVREVSDVKQYDSSLTEFLEGVAMLPEALIREGGRTLKTLEDEGMISPISLSDILHDLHHHQLNKEKLVSFLRWWIGAKQNTSNDQMDKLLNTAVYRDEGGKKLPLSAVRRFVDPRALGIYIPQDCPPPPSLLPQDVAKYFTTAQLNGFGWQEFTVVDWLRHISQVTMSLDPKPDFFAKSPDWAVCVLHTVSRIWSSSSNDIRALTRDVVKQWRCIPTSDGLCTPNESYLPGTSIDLFRDLRLPMVQFPDGSKITGELEALLSSVGVRKHVDPKLILERMEKTKIWNIPGLIRYLGQVRDSLAQEEVSFLESSDIFTTERTLNDNRRYCACELYAPNEVFRRLQLPVIQWDQESKWLDGSDEAKLLFRLKLRRYPPLRDIVNLCSVGDVVVRTTAFRFFCDNLALYHDYDPRDFENITFIPAENKKGNHLAGLSDVFWDKRWKVLGFSVVQDNYRNVHPSELGISEHPPIPKLLSHLRTTQPPDEIAAEKWFEILSEQISAFEPGEVVLLGKLQIVPTGSSRERKWLCPTQCYLGEGTQDGLYSKLFAFVTFGPVAKRFLTACGSRNEPTVTDVAKSLVDDPERFEKLTDGYENFLTQLRNLAVNKHRIPNTTLSKMRFGRILLGKKTMTRQGWSQHERRSPHEIFIADDINAYHLFRDAIFIAPQEELLEEFYASLGCKRLSEVVREECEVIGDIKNPVACSKMRDLVLERLSLFLYEFTYAKPRYSIDWLSRAENFRVKICKSLSISKTLTIGDKPIQRPQPASAGAKKDNQGHIELWISQDALEEPDMYEVSTSLCRLLFGTAKVSESLLFTMILSTDLDALRRRGCNVDLILRRRQLELNELNGDDVTEEVVSESSSSPEPPSQATPSRTTEPEVLTPPPDQPPRASQAPQSDAREPGASMLSTGPEPPHSTSISHNRTAEAEESTPCVPLEANEPEDSEAEDCTPTPPTPPNRGKQNHVTGLGSRLRKFFSSERQSPTETVGTAVGPPQPVSQWTQQCVIPPDSIRTNVDMAIKASKPGETRALNHLKDIEEINKLLTDRCYDSGQVDNLTPVGELPVRKRETIKVHVAKDVPDHDRFMKSKKKTLDRFANIIVPIATQAYELPVTSLNIFYDASGGTIAFNQERSLYLNLRFFEEWHDQAVAKGDKRPAQISWFFTLAHEIAHNLVESHNAEHEFWFSAICEERIDRLV